MRIFIATFIPEEIKEEIIKIQEVIKKLPMKAKLVEKENLHLSYTFLGEKSEKEVEEISSKLSIIVKKFQPFEILLDKIQFIPNKNFFRVIAIRVLSEIGEEIRKVIFNEIGGSSHPLHLTLARVKLVREKEKVLEKLEKIKLNNKFCVKEICVVKSVLTPSGPIYRKVACFSLQVK